MGKRHRPRVYFGLWPAFPHFSMLTLHTALLPYHALCMSDGQTLGDFLSRGLEESQEEMVKVCVEQDIGESTLCYPLPLLEEVVGRMMLASHSAAQFAFHDGLQMVEAHGCIPIGLYAQQNLNALQVHLLQVACRPYARRHPALPGSPQMWSPKDWDSYFNIFPGDEVRVPILHAVSNVAKTSPASIIPRVRQLFPSILQNRRVAGRYQDSDNHSSDGRPDDGNADLW